MRDLPPLNIPGQRVTRCARVVKDAFNTRWNELVTYGLHIAFERSSVVGWYKSSVTIGPKPKYIRTGATLHSVCVTFGPLATHKLHVHVCGGREDEDMNKNFRTSKGLAFKSVSISSKLFLPTSWVVATLPQ